MNSSLPLLLLSLMAALSSGCETVKKHVAFNDVKGRIIQSSIDSTHLDAKASAKIVEEFDIVITGDVCYGDVEGARAVFDFSDVPTLALVSAIAGVDISVITINDGDAEACVELGVQVRREVDGGSKTD